MTTKTKETVALLCFLCMVVTALIALTVVGANRSPELVTVVEAMQLELRVAELEGQLDIIYQRLSKVEKNQWQCTWMEQGVK